MAERAEEKGLTLLATGTRCHAIDTGNEQTRSRDDIRGEPSSSHTMVRSKGKCSGCAVGGASRKAEGRNGRGWRRSFMLIFHPLLPSSDFTRPRRCGCKYLPSVGICSRDVFELSVAGNLVPTCFAATPLNLHSFCPPESQVPLHDPSAPHLAIAKVLLLFERS